MKALEVSSRTAHFIDIENLSQSSILDEELVRRVKSEYFARVEPGLDDIFFIGVSHFNLAAASFGWGSGVARYLVRSGNDGADLALLELLSDPSTLTRFNKIVIASGDGIFSKSNQMLAARGIQTTYVARQDAVARDIFLSGCGFMLLPPRACHDISSIPLLAKEYALVS